MNDIKKLLKDSAPDILPDDKIKDNIKAQAFGGGAQFSAATAGGGTRAIGSKRNILIAACAAVLAVAIALCLWLPSLNRSTGLPGGGLTADQNKLDTSSAQSFYAYGAASVGAVISSREAPSTAAVAAASATFRTDISAAQDERIQTVNRYLALVEGLLSDGAIESEAIDGGNYAYGMTITYNDLLGNSVSYQMYYDAHPLGSEADDDEIEEFYSIEGILVVGGESYPVEGSYTTQSGDGEEESELYFRAYTARNSYIEVNRESENETEDGEEESEYKYIYTVCTEGDITERTVVEYEREEDELELLLNIERDGLRESLIFEDETEDGQRVIAVSGNIDGQSVSFRIYVREGQYHYVFEDGSQFDYDRFDKDDDDDDNDEDDDDGDWRRAILVCA